jgi:NAD(P)-dependent dehydrogenase (short-subunit alcohol dehydrogenase family)
VVLANAGTEGKVAPVTQTRPEDVARLFAVNVFGPVRGDPPRGPAHDGAAARSS